MKAWKGLLPIILTILFVPSVIAQSSPEGNWTTIDDKTGKKRAEVHLSITNGVLSGTILKVYPQPGDTGVCNNCPGKLKNQPAVGLRFVWGLREKSPGLWSGGEIVDGKTGKVYRVKMSVKGNKLYVRGYVGVSMLGRTQIWERA